MSLDLSNQDLDRLFPAYMETNKSGLITACGPSLARHCERSLIQCNLLDAFEVERPLKTKSAGDLLIDNQSVILCSKENPALKLRGIVVKRADHFVLLLGYTPTLAANNARIKYRFSDFAPYDATQDIFIAAQVRQGLLEDTQSLVNQLNREKLAAEAANIAKSNFLACMSHEIRTPLNGVLGMASILSDTRLTADQKDLVNVLRESGETLLTLLNDILDLSKIDAGQTQIEETSFTLAELTDSIEKIYKFKCEDKNLQFELDIEDAVRSSAYSGDAFRIRQILNNLLSNAVKFTKRGDVSIKISQTDSSQTNRPTLNFSVRDTGIGVAAENLNSLFSPFVQADTAVTRIYGGTGLGLSICKRLCELMGGTMGAVSEEGVGSTFSFSLPVTKLGGVIKARKREHRSANAVVAPAEKRLSILAAEDNIVNQKVLKAMSESLCHDITMVNNGAEALNALSNNQFDVVLMDIQMPVMDGIDATKKIRERERADRTDRAPVVAVTANAMKEHEDEYLSVGFDHYLAKPITKEKLSRLISQLFNSQQAERLKKTRTI